MTKQISPLRQRMIDDMAFRNMSPNTQKVYSYAVAKFARFHHRSPDNYDPLGAARMTCPASRMRSRSERTWLGCASVSGWFMPSARSQDPPRSSPISLGIPIGSRSADAEPHDFALLATLLTIVLPSES